MKFWEISDSFWEAVKPLIPETVRDPEKVYQRISGGGRKPLDQRKVFSAIVYVLKTGTQWKSLPKEFYGSPSSIHAYFKKWEAQGFFSELWKKGLAEFEEMKGIAWEWTLDTTRVSKPAAQGPARTPPPCRTATPGRIPPRNAASGGPSSAAEAANAPRRFATRPRHYLRIHSNLDLTYQDSLSFITWLQAFRARLFCISAAGVM